MAHPISPNTNAYLQHSASHDGSLAAQRKAMVHRKQQGGRGCVRSGRGARLAGYCRNQRISHHLHPLRSGRSNSGVPTGTSTTCQRAWRRSVCVLGGGGNHKDLNKNEHAVSTIQSLAVADWCTVKLRPTSWPSLLWHACAVRCAAVFIAVWCGVVWCGVCVCLPACLLGRL